MMNEYTKMTENENAYSKFCCKITKFFQNFVGKGLYSPNLCDIITEVAG